MDHPMIPQEQLLNEAADWFARMQDPQYTQAMRDEFASWLLRSPAHIGAFLKVARAWGDIGLIGDDTPSIEELVSGARTHEKPSNVVVLPTRMQSPDSLLAMEDDEEAPPLATPMPSRRRARWMAVSAAAALVVAVVALGWITAELLLHDPSYIRTAIGEQRSVALADGSVVQLNTNSELRVEITPTERRIRLERGEARFTVARDPNRPFLVTTPQATVRALGTIFNVQIAPQGTDVAVLEGHVEVISGAQAVKAIESAAPPTAAEDTAVDAAGKHRGSAASDSAAPAPTAPEPMVLSAGEQAAVTATGEILPNVGPPLERVRGWTDRRLVFREETLATLVAEVNRYHEHPILIGDPEIAGLRISGTFAAHDLPSLIEYLERYRGVEAEVAPDGTQILRRSTRETAP